MSQCHEFQGNSEQQRRADASSTPKIEISVQARRSPRNRRPSCRREPCARLTRSMMPKTESSPPPAKQQQAELQPVQELSTTSSMVFQVGARFTRVLSARGPHGSRRRLVALPHHEGSRGVQRLPSAGGPHPEEHRAKRCVSKGEATDANHLSAKTRADRKTAAARAPRCVEHVVITSSGICVKVVLTVLDDVATVLSESVPSASFTTSCR